MFERMSRMRPCSGGGFARLGGTVDWKQVLQGKKRGRGMSTHVAWMTSDFGRRDYSPLSAADVEALATVLEPVDVEAGQRILSPGEPADTAFIVEKGEVELLVRRGGRRALINIQRRGGVFGDVPLLCEMPFPFIAVARTDATLLKLDRDRLIDLLSAHPAVALRWLVNVVQRLERANRRVVSLTLGDLRSRVLALLADELVSTEDGSDIGLTQAEMAALLGATRQSVNRVLRKLAGEGLLRQRYGKVEIEDPERVIQLAEGSAPSRVS